MTVSNEDLLAWMKNVHQEMRTIRQLASDAVNYMRGAEKEVPEFMRRFANYMHDLHDIRYMYEELGHPVPDWIRNELQRCDDRLRQLLDRLHTDGGAFEKVRREMSADPENRWDHTKLLYSPKKENGSEAGQS